MCREEAAKLSSLRPELDQLNVPLYGILHEEQGSKSFKNYFQGELFLDEEKAFYDAQNGWMGLLGMARLSVLRSALRARSGGYQGNLKGEGRLLGSTVVVGPGEQGILFEYHEQEFGDHAPISDIADAVRKIKNE